MFSRASEREGSAAGSLYDLLPRTCHWLSIELAGVGLWDQAGEISANHLIVAATKHFRRRWIHRTNQAFFIDGNHAVENVFDDGADACFYAFEFGQLPPNEHEAVTI